MPLSALRLKRFTQKEISIGIETSEAKREYNTGITVPTYFCITHYLF